METEVPDWIQRKATVTNIGDRAFASYTTMTRTVKEGITILCLLTTRL